MSWDVIEHGGEMYLIAPPQLRVVDVGDHATLVRDATGIAGYLVREWRDGVPIFYRPGERVS